MSAVQDSILQLAGSADSRGDVIAMEEQWKLTPDHLFAASV